MTAKIQAASVIISLPGLLKVRMVTCGSQPVVVGLIDIIRKQISFTVTGAILAIPIVSPAIC
jgi:hypothetical protein